jgi:hypothetical protein
MPRANSSPKTHRAHSSNGLRLGLGISATLLLQLSLGIGAAAQQLGVDTTQIMENPGTETGNYQTNGSLEMGVQVTGVGGSSAMYDTLVNLQTGPRILEQSLSMRSLNHQGLIFDRLNMYSFGYGGNPNQATRFSMSKDKWYDFSMMYRKDQNVWDYNVLANPLNPVNPVLINVNSPHMMETRRNMQNYDLTLFPVSRFRVRLGFDWNSNSGPSFSSFHEGTDVGLTQPFRVTTTTYRFGFDYRLFKNTTISYDQSFVSVKNDTSWSDQSQYWPLSNGALVDIGLPYNPSAGLPCANPFPSGSYNPTCNGYYSYTRTSPMRSYFPTEKISLQSQDIRHLDLTASFAYSGGYNQINDYSEAFSGLVTRTNEKQFTFSGPSKVNRVLTDGELGATYHFTEKLSLSDTFRWWNSRQPGYWNSLGTSCFPNGSTSLLSGIGIFNSPGILPTICAGGSGLPIHTSSSPADIDSTNYYRYQNLNFKFNTTTLEYTFNKRVGGHIGFRYADQQVHTNDNPDVTDSGLAYYYPNNATRGGACTQTLADGTCVIVTPFQDAAQHYADQSYTGMFGVWVRPLDSLRVNGDVELTSAGGLDGFLITRIQPTNAQLYRVRARYTPVHWIVVSGTLNWQENLNHAPDDQGTIQSNNRGHNRFFGFDVSLLPKGMFAFDVGYNYNNVYSATDVCINLGTRSTAADPCYAGSSGSNTFANWRYHNTVNSTYFNLTVRPKPWLAFAGGLNLVGSTGQDPLYLPVTHSFTVANPLQPLGSLDSLYWRPSGSLAFSFHRNWEAKGAYNYYDYNERSYQGPIPPRDFHASMGTVSVKYVF